MFAIRIELCMGNILANFTPLPSRGKGRKRLAAQAAEPCGNILLHTPLNKYVSGSVLAQNDFMPQGFALFLLLRRSKKMRTLAGS